jgi:hypothetical protein
MAPFLISSSGSNVIGIWLARGDQARAWGGTLAAAHPWKMGVEGQGVSEGWEASKRGKEVWPPAGRAHRFVGQHYNELLLLYHYHCHYCHYHCHCQCHYH